MGGEGQKGKMWEGRGQGLKIFIIAQQSNCLSLTCFSKVIKRFGIT